MIEESQWGAIRALRQQGRSKKAIARELDLDIKTVRKWLKRKRWRPQKRRRQGQILDQHEAQSVCLSVGGTLTAI